MVPSPNCPDKWDYWTSSPTEQVELICLMPNSVYIPLKASWDATLQDLKKELWELAASYPRFSALLKSSDYVFQFVSSLAVPEKVDDETVRLRDVKPTLGVLTLKTSVSCQGEHNFNTQISHLIGKGLNEFDSLMNSEVDDFRLRMRRMAEESVMKRSGGTLLDKLKYQSPPRLAESKKIPSTLCKYLETKSNCFEMDIMFADSKSLFPLIAPATRSPQKCIEIVFMTLQADADNLNSETMQGVQSHNYVLKVCGRDEYLYGNDPLIQFLYIQEALASRTKPRVMLINIQNLKLIENHDHMKLSPMENTCNETNDSLGQEVMSCESSWSITCDYTCVVEKVCGLNIDPDTVEVGCEIGIYHSGRSLCEKQKIVTAVSSSSGIAEWNTTLKFPINVCNIPRMARLCFGVYAKTKKANELTYQINKLAWVNIQIFDYKEQLQTGGMKLGMWTHVANDSQEDDLLLHPVGTSISKPKFDSSAELHVHFSNYGLRIPIKFPAQNSVMAYSENFDNASPEELNTISKNAILIEKFKWLKSVLEDPNYEIHEQERKDIWASQDLVRLRAPAMLPMLLSCVDWCDRVDMSKVTRLLSEWPKLDHIESALELLDYSHADAAVRHFAVKCLERLRDDEILLYLMQFVQALKHESYLMCELANFLLQRAFNNMTIGHYLFWHLRSEMHIPLVSIRFGLILEAYCRGAPTHVGILMRQITCLDKLKWLGHSIQQTRDIGSARYLLSNHLKEEHCVKTLTDFVSPLDPTLVCRKIRLEGCRVMDSKMRPLMLEFENGDPTGEHIRIIFKVGDDLRQDMFTLQMLRIMDRLWKREDLDFRLNAYNCISMEHRVGMIQVVEEAETIAKIQKQSALCNATSAFQNTSLLKWLRKHSKNIVEAVEEFTMSCAGYCAATYVLGIADRHPDNIMLKKNGQLFHIDFGHFLGHFKQKYGIKRERVPFVLTRDFLHVIKVGNRITNKDNYKIFKEHCEKAYIILRKNGHIIKTLFSLMMSTGLPELRTESDLNYLQKTLVLHLTEKKALEHFQLRYDESSKMKNQYTTTVNWTIHNIDRNN